MYLLKPLENPLKIGMEWQLSFYVELEIKITHVWLFYQTFWTNTYSLEKNTLPLQCQGTDFR